MSGICHDACRASADCPTGQSCVKTDNATLCQLPAEADCSTLSCSGGLVCAVDLRCRAACLSRTDCTTEQICVGGVCAAPNDLDPNGQLPQKGSSLGADGGVNVPDAESRGADLAVGAADAQVRDAGANDLAKPAPDAPISTQPDSGAGTGSDARTADGGGILTVADAGAADVSPMTSATLTASTSSLACGSVVTGQSCNTSFMLTNSGQQASGAITVTSDSSDFVVQTGGALDCVSTKTILAPNASCTVRVVFSPKLPVARTGTVTFSATPGGSGPVNISGTGVCPADQQQNDAGTCVPLVGVVWTQEGIQQPWVSVASSSDGTNLVAVSGGDDNAGYIYTSADSGVTWVQRTSTKLDWYSVASSSDGTKLVAAAMNDYIYTSVDAGLTWVQRGNMYEWSSVASSADGTKLVAGSLGGYIYTSVDSGLTWTQRGTAQFWSSMASSSDGTKLVAVTAGGFSKGIYTSADSGVTWTQTDTQSGWVSVASSSDGTKLVAAVGNNGYIYKSSDSGVTWTQTTAPEQPWMSVASSSDGMKLVAVNRSQDVAYTVYTSTDSGATWTQQDTSRNWSSVASSADGTKLVAVTFGGYIYTSSGPVP